MGLFKKKQKKEDKMTLKAFMEWLDEGLTEEQRGNMLLNLTYTPEKKLREDFGPMLSETDFKAFMGFLNNNKRIMEDDPQLQAIRRIINND